MSYFDDNEDYLTGLNLPVRVKIPRFFIERKQLQIQILAVNKQQATTSTGKPYDKLDIAYKNLSFGGKVEGKLVMPFGTTAAAHKVLSNATGGQVYDINVVKNEKGYNDWTSATLSKGDPQVQQEYSQQPPRYASQAAPSPARASTFETPEERAKKQVAITRLATLNTAVASLTPGAKAALKPADVIAIAKEFEGYVYNVPTAKESSMDVGSGFDDMDSDVPL